MILLFISSFFYSQLALCDSKSCSYYYSNQVKFAQINTLKNSIVFNSEAYHLQENKITEAPADAFIEWSLQETLRSLQLEPVKTNNLYASAEGKTFVKYFKWNTDKEFFPDLTRNQKMEENLLDYAIFYILSPHSLPRFRYLQSQNGSIYKEFWRHDFDRQLWTDLNMAPPSFPSAEVGYMIEKLRLFPLKKLIDNAPLFGLSPAEINGIKYRFSKLYKSLHLSDGAFKDETKLTQVIKLERQRNKKQFQPEVIAQIRQRLTARFLKDFEKHSKFKNFEEYKQQVLAVPEYRKIIDDIFQNGKISVRLPGTIRVGILTNGIQNLFETRKSTFMEGLFEDNPYMKLRESVESEALDLSTEQYKASLPSQYRAKSFFFDLTKPTWTQSTVMGNDIYVLDFNKVLAHHKEGKLVLTLTLGDSARSSAGWQGRAIPIELFPYFAAPFIFQAQSETHSAGELMAPAYRRNIYGVSDTLPSFHNHLEKKLDLFIREDSSMVDEFNPRNMVTDYIEAQIFGEVSPDLISEFLPEKNVEKMTNALKKAFQIQGIQVND